LQFLNYRLDHFIVSYLVGVAGVGFYVVATSLAELVWYLPDAFGFVLFPRTASSDLETARQFTPRIVRISAFATVVAALVLFLGSRLAITALYTEDYLPSLRPLWALLPGVVALSYSKVIFSDLGGRGKPFYGTLASLLSLVVTLGLDLLLIPELGIAGAAVASSLGYAANAVLAIVFYVRVTGHRLADLLVVQKDDIAASLSAGRDAILMIAHLIRT